MTAQIARRFHVARALRSRPFALLWSGQTISALGDGAYFTALAWQVLLLTHSGTAMGLLLVAASVPRLIFLLVGGIAADRLPRRLVLFWSDAGRAVVVLAIAVLGWTQLLQFWHLVILALLFGFVGAFFGPAYRAMPPQLVELEALPSANALTQLSVQFGGLLGPVLGAGLVALASPASAFAFDGLTFVVSAISLFFIRLPAQAYRSTEGDAAPAKPAPIERRGIGGMLADLREGWVYILGSTWLVMTIIVPAFVNVGFSGPITVALPKLIHDVYRSGVWLLGAIGTAEAIGAIGATFFVGQFHLRKRGIIAFLGNILASLAILAFGLPLPRAIEPAVAIGAATLAGFGLNVLQTIWITLLHELVPNHLLGRVASIDLLGSLCLLPVGYALAGVLTDRIGPAWVFILGGGMTLAVNIVPLCLRDIRTIE